MSGSVPVCIFLHLHLLCHCGVPREKSVCVCVVSLNKAHFVRARHLVWCMHIDTVSQRMSDPNSYCIYADHRFSLCFLLIFYFLFIQLLTCSFVSCSFVYCVFIHFPSSPSLFFSLHPVLCLPFLQLSSITVYSICPFHFVTFVDLLFQPLIRRHLNHSLCLYKPRTLMSQCVVTKNFVLYEEGKK